MMSDDSKITFSRTDLENLHHLSALVHLFYHRNKNQHRRSVWWRHFSTFRRQLYCLSSEVQRLHGIPKTHLQKTKKKAQDRQTLEVILKRLKFWEDVLVPKWHGCFSQIVTDARFAVLGLVLIAVLAQACHIVGLSSGCDDAKVAEAEEALQELVESSNEPKIQSLTNPITSEEDVGEIVDRATATDEASQVTEVPPQAVGNFQADTTRSSRSAASLTPARKRRKTGNAIDDLFSSLG